MSNKLQSDDHVDLGKFSGDFQPGSQVCHGNVGQDLRSLAQVFECHVRILLGDLQPDGQDLGTDIAGIDQPKDQGAFLEIFQCGRAG